ncbi:hypothetical protein GGI17_003352 [Coemansia sp. S146]|nr:hypothetical protein GGI17_003352 [Coemansia sp. S146]
MLTVCSGWRQAALERLWRKLEFAFNGMTNELNLSPPPWLSKAILSPSAANMAKELHVTVPWSTLVDGTAYKLLSESIGDTRVLPSAYKLVFMVSDYTGGSSYPKDIAISNALDFAQLLKSMVPAATTIEVLTAIRLVLEDNVEEELTRVVNDITNDVMSNENEVVSNEELIGTFSQTLYAGINRAVLDLGLAGFKNRPVIGLIPQLSWLAFTSGMSPTLNANLAHSTCYCTPVFAASLV